MRASKRALDLTALGKPPWCLIKRTAMDPERRNEQPISVLGWDDSPITRRRVGNAWLALATRRRNPTQPFNTSTGDLSDEHHQPPEF